MYPISGVLHVSRLHRGHGELKEGDMNEAVLKLVISPFQHFQMLHDVKVSIWLIVGLQDS